MVFSENEEDVDEREEVTCSWNYGNQVKDAVTDAQLVSC